MHERYPIMEKQEEVVFPTDKRIEITRKNIIFGRGGKENNIKSQDEGVVKKKWFQNKIKKPNNHVMWKEIFRLDSWFASL